MIQPKAVTAPAPARFAGSRKNPEPIMLLATTKVASNGPILRVRAGPPSKPLGLRTLVELRLGRRHHATFRSEEHTSELQSLMRISYAVFCLKKKTKTKPCNNNNKAN